MPQRWTRASTPRDLGGFISHLRTQHGWSQKQVADRLGIPVRYIHEIESGKDILAYRRLFALLDLLDADLQIRERQSAPQAGNDENEGTDDDPWAF